MAPPAKSWCGQSPPLRFAYSCPRLGAFSGRFSAEPPAPPHASPAHEAHDVGDAFGQLAFLDDYKLLGLRIESAAEGSRYPASAETGPAVTRSGAARNATTTSRGSWLFMQYIPLLEFPHMPV
jgi:hypothetical protein